MASTPSATVVCGEPTVARTILVSMNVAGCSATDSTSGRRAASSLENMIWASLLCM